MFCLLVFILVLFLVGAGYSLWVPVPAGYSQPWIVRVVFAIVKLFRFMVTDTMFDGVPVRIYTPRDKDALSIGLVYLHGGGGVFASVDVYDSFTRRLAWATNGVVVSVDYRLAPEHIFPAGFEDCVKATKHFITNAADFGVDASRVCVAGDSHGGGLAATTTLRLRDDGLSPSPKMQILIYPALQFASLRTPSYISNANDCMSNVTDVSLYRTAHIQGHIRNANALIQNLHTSPQMKAKLASTYMDISKLPKDMVPAEYVPEPLDIGDEKLYKEFEPFLLNPYACPLFAEDLSNLPMTYIFTGQNDVLRDEGFWYAQRLTESGVSVTHRHAELGYHGIFNQHRILHEADLYFTEVTEFIKNNL